MSIIEEFKEIMPPLADDIGFLLSRASGLVVLASNMSTARYWHADLALGASADTTAGRRSHTFPVQRAVCHWNGPETGPG